MILGVVFFEGAVRKIPVQYANRQAGQQGSDIPIKLNSASVIPVIFASTILSVPLTIIGVMGLNTESSTAAYWINQVFATSEPIGIIIYVILIVFFSFFYSLMQVDPEELADNFEKQGAIAVEQLISLIKGEPGEHITINGRIIPRESTRARD